MSSFLETYFGSLNHAKIVVTVSDSFGPLKMKYGKGSCVVIMGFYVWIAS